MDDRVRPIAEVWRRTGACADRLGLVRPSYEQVRTLVHAARARAAARLALEVVVDVRVRLTAERRRPRRARPVRVRLRPRLRPPPRLAALLRRIAGR